MKAQDYGEPNGHSAYRDIRFTTHPQKGADHQNQTGNGDAAVKDYASVFRVVHEE